MTLDAFLPSRWRAQGEAAAHSAEIAGILDTPPIQPRQDGLVLFAMVGSASLLPYLVAVKSLWRELRRGRVAILGDGTLTAQDRALLAHHCGDPELLRLDQVQTGPFPKGGGWERLLTILDRRSSEYWLQLDVDTVTLGPVPEIADAIGRNRSVILLAGDEAAASPEPAAHFTHRRYPLGPDNGEVQARVESRLDTLPPRLAGSYVRGGAGLAGFAALGAGRPLAAAFLSEMAGMIGSAVEEPGAAQVAANFQLANDPQPVILPYRHYLDYAGHAWAEDAAFVHFGAAHRHDHGAYATASRAAIERLRGDKA